MITLHTSYKNKQPTVQCLHISIRNGVTSTSSYTTNVFLPTLPKEVILLNIIFTFQHYSLFSLPRLTKSVYKIKFGENIVVMKNGKPILFGHFDPKKNSFWIIITNTAEQINSYMNSFYLLQNQPF